MPQDVTALGLLMALVCGLCSFWLGRRLSRRWQAHRHSQQQTIARAQETRQQRRARERTQSKKG